MLKLILYFFIIIVLSINTAFSQYDISIRLSPANTQTSTLYETFVSPFPNHPDFIAYAGELRMRTLFRFDLHRLPPGATILDATISFYANPSNSFPPHYGSNHAYIRRVKSAWDPTVLWNTQPAYYTQNEKTTPVVNGTGAGGNLINFNIRNLVSDAVAEPDKNFGFIFMLKNNSFHTCVNFASITCPDTSKRPILKIKYLPKSHAPDFSVRLNTTTGMTSGIFYDQPDIPFPNYYDLVAYAWTNNGVFSIARSLFKFNLDVIPKGTKIKYARLCLYDHYSPHHPAHSGDNKSAIRKINMPWNNQTVTWNSRPAYTLENQILTNDIAGGLEMDITTLIKDAVRNPESYYGFVLMLQTENTYRMTNFGSVNASTIFQPLLEIFYDDESNNEPESLPKELTVFQNFPNPFNPITYINFEIPNDGKAELRIYDMRGAIVKSIFNEFRTAGYYWESFDGSEFSSGIYFYRLVIEGKAITKKMMLIK